MIGQMSLNMEKMWMRSTSTTPRLSTQSPHKRLLAKLSGYDIGGKLLKWIAAFLERRRQRVNGSKSSWTRVTSHIPQGSVLGPLLFVCYVNDMPENITSTAYMFADDTKVYRNITTHIDREVLQSDLSHLED